MNKYMLLRQILKQHSLYPFSLFFIIFLIICLKNVSKVTLKILQARLHQYVNCELPDVQAGFRKGRGTRDQIANIHWINEKTKESSRKTSISALLTMPKLLTVWITINCGKF